MTNWFVAPFGWEIYSVFESRLPYCKIYMITTIFPQPVAYLHMQGKIAVAKLCSAEEEN